MTKPFSAIGVAGAGTMGAGIAQVCALAGYKTVLYDTSVDVLDRAIGYLYKSVEKGIERHKLPGDAITKIEAHLQTSHTIDVLGENLDLVIEAIPEDLALKQRFFAQLDEMCPKEACFVSNTSSFSITALGSVTKRPEQVAGMHFFNPVPQMKLVEIIQSKSTSEGLLDRLAGLAQFLGKTSVRAKDTPGFIVNRVARSFYGEALRLLDEGVSDVPTIDQIMREEGGFLMGPFELMDLIGIDVNYAVSQSVYHAYFEESRFKPHPLQQQMVEAGHLGRKTGKGFYTYD